MRMYLLARRPSSCHGRRCCSWHRRRDVEDLGTQPGLALAGPCLCRPLPLPALALASPYQPLPALTSHYRPLPGSASLHGHRGSLAPCAISHWTSTDTIIKCFLCQIVNDGSSNCSFNCKRSSRTCQMPQPLFIFDRHNLLGESHQPHSTKAITTRPHS